MSIIYDMRSGVPVRSRLYSNGLNTVDMLFKYNPLKLFIGGKQGVWYDPSDLTTLYQDANGTTPVTTAGDPVGLMLDKSQGLTLGTELVTNGDFSNGLTGWTGLSATISLGDGGLVVIGANESANHKAESMAFTTEIGKTYLLTYNVLRLSGGSVGVILTGLKTLGGNLSYSYPHKLGVNTLMVYASSESSKVSFHSGTAPYAEAVFGTISVRELKGNHAVQPLSAARPTYSNTPPSLVLDKVDDALIINVPTGGWIGTMVLASANGTASYGVNIPAGNYTLGGQYFPATNLVGAVFRHSAMTAEEKDSVESYFEGKGAVRSFAGVTDFSSLWRGRSEITSFPLINTSHVTNMSVSWYLCSGLTSFPLIDTSTVTLLASTWQGCTSLISFPLLNTANVINVASAWFNCTSLTSFPLINTSSVTGVAYAWYQCTSLTSFPLINTSKMSNFSETWYNCRSLTSFPLIDTSSATVLGGTWKSCMALTSFPAINTANVTNMGGAWLNCASLTSFPLLNTSKVTNINSTWSGCTSLTNFPANMFDSVKTGDFTSAFTNTKLSQVSIDGILVSLVTSGIATGTRVFNQSGGSAPSATGNTAIDTLRSRGWTVTVTGGY